MISNSSLEEQHIPPQVYNIIHEFFLGVDDKQLDLQEAHLRPSVAKIYPVFIAIYAILIGVGVLSNLAAFIHIVRHKLYNDSTCCFIINLLVSDVVKCVCVLPISLYVLLVQNWILGEVLCSTLPMLQVSAQLHRTIIFFKLCGYQTII